MVDDLDLVEEDEGVENGEGRVVQYARQDHILEILQAPRVADFPADEGIFDRNDLFKAGLVREVLPMVGFVGGEFGII